MPIRSSAPRKEIGNKKRPASRDLFDGAVRQTNHMREIERLPRRTEVINVQPITKGYGPFKAELRQRNPNKSSLYDVIQNRHRTEVLCKLVFPANDATNPLDTIWWSRTGSNRRPPACKAGALPAELRPLFGEEEWWAWIDSNYRPHPYQGCALTT